MYVKLFNRILDSSIADNRKLRHFFTDLLLCADVDGNILMTKQAIANRIRAGLEEVEWGILELMKPEKGSLTPDLEGRRLVPLDGHGYGWKIVNFEAYRDLKSAEELRRKTSERVARWREKNKGKKLKRGKPLPGQASYEKREREGASEKELNDIGDNAFKENSPEYRVNGEA